MTSRFLPLQIGLSIACACVSAVALGGILAACSTQAKAVAQGGQCFQAIDCQDGLVCVPQPDGRSACTNDVSGIVHIEDAAVPREAAARDGMADGQPGDGAVSDAPPADTAPPVEAATD